MHCFYVNIDTLFYIFTRLRAFVLLLLSFTAVFPIFVARFFIFAFPHILVTVPRLSSSYPLHLRSDFMFTRSSAFSHLYKHLYPHCCVYLRDFFVPRLLHTPFYVYQLVMPLPYALLMRANKPETALQRSASFFYWHHMVFSTCFTYPSPYHLTLMVLTVLHFLSSLNFSKVKVWNNTLSLFTVHSHFALHPCLSYVPLPLPPTTSKKE